MKYIAEQDRKFTDLGGVKIYHSIFPVLFTPDEKAWGPVIRFDNKALLPGRQEIQHYIGSPLQVLRVVINGSLEYFDSQGYRTVLTEQDAFSVDSGKDILSAVIQNNDDQSDTEFLEIWTLSAETQRSYQFHSGPAGREKGKFYTVISTEGKDADNQPQQKKTLRIGSFNAGVTQTISGIAEGHRLMMFIFNGEVSANSQLLSYRDTAIFSHNDNIALEFAKDTNMLLLEIGREVSVYE